MPILLSLYFQSLLSIACHCLFFFSSGYFSFLSTSKAFSPLTRQLLQGLIFYPIKHHTPGSTMSSLDRILSCCTGMKQVCSSNRRLQPPKRIALKTNSKSFKIKRSHNNNSFIHWRSSVKAQVRGINQLFFPFRH